MLGPAKLQRLSKGGDCKYGNSLAERRCNLIEAMTVAICLNDGHDPGTPCQLSDYFQIVTQGGMVDFHPGSSGEGEGRRGTLSGHRFSMEQKIFSEKLLLSFLHLFYPFHPRQLS